MRHIRSVGLAASLALMAMAWTSALAHGGGHDAMADAKRNAPAEQTAFGVAGDASKVSRTIDMDALDTFRFTPDMLTVKRGETIRFVVHNKGRIEHEIVIGTMKELKEHAARMKKFPEMEHESANMAHVAPGQSGEIVWTFNRPGTFNFACLIAGHFEAGMIGTVVVS
jgi:uncharacterized cupredoxin-like copper-binding protein